MHCTLRTLQRPDDYPRLAEIFTATGPRPWTAAELEALNRELAPEALNDEYVAVDQEGRVVGYGQALRRDPDEGDWEVFVTVDPNQWGRGIGSALVAEVGQAAQQRGAADLRTWVTDPTERVLAFAQRHGYTVEQDEVRSRLNLDGFDDARFTDALQLQGVRFTTLADEPADGPDRLYDLARRVFPDVPNLHQKPLPAFEAWLEEILEECQGRRDLILIAALGDRYVGTTRLNPVRRDEGALYTSHTAVDREYRGRRLGLALKLRSIELARSLGKRSMLTDNDTWNTPILELNRLLGYHPEHRNVSLHKSV